MIKTPSRLLFLLLITLLVYACKKDKAEAPPPNPIAAYNFDNDLAMNSMSSVLHGDIEGNLSNTVDSFKTTHSAFLFSGTGFVRVLDSDLLDFPGNQFTISAWIRPSKTSGTYIVHKAANSGGGGPYSLDIHPGSARALVHTTTDEAFVVTGTTKIVKDVWQHVAVTFTGKQLTVYYNGKAEDSKAVDRPLEVSTGDLAIGAYVHAFPSASFQGTIDNVRIYDKALTTDQIMNLYQNYKK